MKNIFVIIFYISFLSAQENVIFFNYSTLKYGEDKHIAYSVNSKWEDKKSFFDGNLDIRAGVTAHQNLTTLKESNISSIINDSRIIIHSLTLDYYINNHTLVSVGRQAMKVNLLSGSFDGILLAHKYHDIQIKTFYFNHYTTLHTTYYENYTIKNLLGTNLIYRDGGFDSEVTIFGNKKNKVSNVYLSYKKISAMLGVEYLNFDSPLIDNEASYKLFLSYKYNSFLFESGIFNVYKGKLKYIYNLGSSEFKVFPLSSFLNQKNAKNIYINLEYNYDYFYTKVHIGKTKFNQENLVYSGKELGMTLGLRYKSYEFASQLLTQKSNQLLNDGKRTNWLQVNLKYRF